MPHAAGQRAGHPPGSHCEECSKLLTAASVVTSTGRGLCGECATTLEAEELALLEHSPDPVSSAVTIRGALGWIRRSKKERRDHLAKNPLTRGPDRPRQNVSALGYGPYSAGRSYSAIRAREPSRRA